MPEAAAKIKALCSNSSLIPFLESSARHELRMDGGSKGRMHFHHLIEEALGGGVGRSNPYVSHLSEGYGADRHLVVRKRGVSGPEELALRRQLQAKHADALRNL